MKKLLLMLLVFSAVSLNAQQSEDKAVIQVIDDFFKAFNAQDTATVKTYLHPDLRMQTIGKNEAGQVVVRSSTGAEFLQRLAGIPAEQPYEEKLRGYKVQTDGEMAHAWTPYEFWFNGEFSHCGVNSFQLAKIDGQWKIIYIVDTRRKEGCEVGG